MSFQQRLYALAIEGLREANRGNPFWSKADAFLFINECVKVM